MAKRKRKFGRVDAKGRNKSKGQYISLPYVMLHSPAWRSLKSPAVKVWLELRSRFNGFNNGELFMSLDEGARLLGMSKSTVKRAYDELEEKGFIIKRKQGHWYGRQATEWEVTDQGCKTQLAKRAWQLWKPKDQISEAGTNAARKQHNMCRQNTE